MPETLRGYDDPAGVAGEQLDLVEKEDKRPIDALVVFGFGIRSDVDLEKMYGGTGSNQIETVKDLPRVRLPIGAKLRIVAATEIFLQGQVQDIIITGGRVKESEGVQASEAELMKAYMEKILRKRWRKELKDEGKLEEEIKSEIEHRWSDASSRILLEDRATNTIENFSHTVNFIDQNKQRYQKIALLSNEFHIDRIMQIANMLQVRGESVSAEPTVTTKRTHYERLVRNYYDLEGNREYRQSVLEAIAPEKKAAEARLGATHEEMLRRERRWSRGLREIPEYWLSNVRFLENPERLRSVLSAEQKVQEVLVEYGIEDIDSASYEDIINALGKVERKIPPEEWAVLSEEEK